MSIPIESSECLEPVVTAAGVHTFSPVAIAVERLQRKFGSFTALDRISFEVPRGHVFGFIGPNGAGKTTTMRILSTLDLPTSGNGYIDGFSVVDDPEYVRSRLGFMPDAFGTYRDISCVEYLDFFARASQLTGKTRLDRLDWVLRFTGTDSMSDKPIDGLSKGMKQRLCLGRAMIHDPAVLVLDEPAAGLDPRARIELRQMIRELADNGKTVLISSHILTELAEICDSVAIIERGELLAVGSVEELNRKQTATRRVSMTVIASNELALHELGNMDTVSKIEASEIQVDFDFAGDLNQQADLIEHLVNQGVKIAEVRSQRQSLEDLFLEVTKGLVQ